MIEIKISKKVVSCLRAIQAGPSAGRPVKGLAPGALEQCRKLKFVEDAPSVNPGECVRLTALGDHVLRLAWSLLLGETDGVTARAWEIYNAG